MLTLAEIREDPKLLYDFTECFLNYKPYKYQKRFLENCFGNNRVAGKWPRQSGKSQTVSVYCAVRGLVSSVSIIIMAPTQSQSSEIYLKIRDLFETSEILKPLVARSTATELKLTNGTRVKTLTAGPEGKSARGFTGDIVILEEAQGIKDYIVNAVVTPMIASKKDEGQVIKIGTPMTKNHFYRSCFIDPNYKVVNVTWQEVVEEGQYSLKFIEEQKANLLDIEFASEYEARFVEEEMAFFPSSLIEDVMLEYKLIDII